MRKCQIDNVAVTAPNASLIAGGAIKVKAGMLFTYQSKNGSHEIARSLGRVNSIPDGLEPCKNYVLAMVASTDMSFGYVRWINPMDITRIIPSPSKFAAFFFAPELPYDAETMIDLIDYGTACEQYIENAPQRVAQFHAKRKSA